MTSPDQIYVFVALCYTISFHLPISKLKNKNQTFLFLRVCSFFIFLPPSRDTQKPSKKYILTKMHKIRRQLVDLNTFLCHQAYLMGYIKINSNILVTVVARPYNFTDIGHIASKKWKIFVFERIYYYNNCLKIHNFKLLLILKAFKIHMKGKMNEISRDKEMFLKINNLYINNW